MIVTRGSPSYSLLHGGAGVLLLLALCGGTPVEALDTRDAALHSIRAKSGRYYPVVYHGLAPGVAQYIDRPSRFTVVPKALFGATFIRAANDDKLSLGPDFLTFEASQPVTVYVAHDNRAKQRPAWLETFEATDEELRVDDLSTRGFRLFRRDFPAGPVTLGGNHLLGRPGSMYTVVIRAQEDDNLPPVPEAAIDRRIWWPRNSIALHGSAYDDRLAEGDLQFTWSLERGPAPVRFEDAHAAQTRAHFTTTGVYRLQLTISDGENVRYDRMNIHVGLPAESHERAARHARQAQEAFRRSHRFHTAWIQSADRSTGLLPRGQRGPYVWSGFDAAADCYPFLVLSAALTDPAAFAGPCRAILETERTLTARIGRLPDNWDLRHQVFFYSEPDTVRIQFGASEYVKDGLLPITEWLGPSPWFDRMLELVEDCWAYAEIETPFGKIVSTGHENNGEMLQTLSRLYWMTGERRYLDWALRLGDYYLLGTNHPTRDATELRLRDHGCEVLSGLCELYATLRFADPARADAYQPPLYEMLDRVLEIGVNPEGFFYDIVNPQTGEIQRDRLGDTFAYNYNGYYTVYLADGHTPYRDAVLRLLHALPRHPAFNGDESMDGNADALEGALYFQNREPQPALAAWIDHAAQTLWQFQNEDGTINRNYLDGNFARSTLLYALWKTQGATLHPWRDDVQLGATRSENEVLLYLRADRPWSGRLRFDAPRHRTYLHLPFDWPRINQFSPEWTTVEAGGHYTLEDAATGETRPVSGEDLLAGLPVELAAGEEKRLVLRGNPPPLPTRITTPADRSIPAGAEIRLAGTGDDLRWRIEQPDLDAPLAEGEGSHLRFTAPDGHRTPIRLRVRLSGDGGVAEQVLTVAAPTPSSRH